MKLDPRYESPFNPQFGRRPDQFVGRDLIVNDFVSSIGHPNDPNRTTILTGIRGSGKTAILSDIHALLEKKGCLVVDVTANDGMLSTIMEEFTRKAKTLFGGKAPAIKNLSAGAMGFSFGIAVEDDKAQRGFRYAVSMALDTLKQKKIQTVFLIDEVHNKTPEMREFAVTYQHLIRENYGVSLLMAGLPRSVSDVLNDHVLTFLRRSHRVCLENVDTKAVAIAYENAFSETGRTFSAGNLKYAADATAGYPYLIQLVGFYLWKTGKTRFGKTDVEQATVLSKIDLFRNVHDLLYRELSVKDREFILAMAKDAEESSFGEIRSRLDVTRGYASKYRERLIEAGIVYSTSYGYLAFSPPYMKEYLEEKLNS
ncbi:MAG: AAA family ATPase [Clostridiales Family XIII bacterium]|jgi:hypothetical protein|nr:AAA family ATPase [Clostridiales Family XIII bacterium]